MKYKVTINGYEDLKFYGLETNEFEENSKVEFYVLFMTDCSTTVSSLQVNLKMDHYDSSRNYWSFEMPSCDVEIQIKSVNNMMKQPMPSNFSMGGMYMNQQFNPITKKRTCPSCKQKTALGGMFCSECGSKLSNEKYRLYYHKNGKDEIYNDSGYVEGEPINIHYPTKDGYYTTVTTNDVALEYDSQKNEYSFEMPNHDVYLNIVECPNSVISGPVHTDFSYQQSEKAESGCPICGMDNPVGSKFCRNCGAKL